MLSKNISMGQTLTIQESKEIINSIGNQLSATTGTVILQYCTSYLNVSTVHCRFSNRKQ